MTMEEVMMLCYITFWFVALFGVIVVAHSTVVVAIDRTYGLDVSFPIQRIVSTNYPWLPHNAHPEGNPTPHRYMQMPLQPLGDRNQIYLNHLNGCRESADDRTLCDHYENSRLLMNQRQPQSMKNYTEVGFKKIRAPETLVRLITRFWEQNKMRSVAEDWPDGNIYCNHWDSPTALVSLDDSGLRGAGPRLKENIWAAAAATLEEWTSQELQPVSLYGIRLYYNNSVMLPHVDRLPLVASAMINVAQDVDEPWPFELYDHKGQAHNITLEPGDMLLFESHSVIHRHPFPLRGRYHAMIFIHFEPTGNALFQDAAGFRRVKRSYPGSTKKTGGIGGQSASSDMGLPPYIQQSSPEEANWRSENPEGWEPPFPVLPPEAHIAAKSGMLDKLEEELKEKDARTILTERDQNGWQILHQGVAGGNQAIVQLLLEYGADINARTHGGYGETPLRIAEKALGNLHPVVNYLKQMGALSIGPEL